MENTSFKLVLTLCTVEECCDEVDYTEEDIEEIYGADVQYMVRGQVEGENYMQRFFAAVTKEQTLDKAVQQCVQDLMEEYTLYKRTQCS